LKRIMDKVIVMVEDENSRSMRRKTNVTTGAFPKH
jgi:hypothetical protein